MAAEPCCPCWIVVVATDKYAGNFEREMCAYCTGVVGECGVGECLAAAFPHDRDKWRGRMLQVPDDHGCRRPASIWGGPEFNDVAMFFADRPSEQELDVIRSRAEGFVGIDMMAYGGPRNKLNILGLKLLKWDGERGREVRLAARKGKPRKT